MPEKEGLSQNVGQSIASALGTGFIDYENYLQHVQVDDYLRTVEWTDRSGGKREGYYAKTTKSHASLRLYQR